MFTQLGRILSSWWRADRPRISPREGRLLHIRPPARLVIAGAVFEVRERGVECRARQPELVYQGICNGKAGQLRVTPDDAGVEAPAIWIVGGIERPVFDEDVEILGEKVRI
jgi:hypothetical protein